MHALTRCPAHAALAAHVALFSFFAATAFAQVTAPARPPLASAPGEAEVERVIVTGSNIPTAEETGPNPVDTYRPADLEKLGIRNAQDLQTFLPQEAGGTVNLNIAQWRRRHCADKLAWSTSQRNVDSY